MLMVYLIARLWGTLLPYLAEFGVAADRDTGMRTALLYLSNIVGSALGSILTGLGLGIVEGLTRVFYPEASAVVVFVIMALVLLVRPAGLFGKEK